MFRTLRGLAGMAVTWGCAWIPLGFVVAVVDAQLHGRSVALSSLPNLAAILFAVGAMCGFAFALLLSFVERRRTFADLSLPRMVAVGIAGGLVIPLTPFVMSPGTGLSAGLVPLAVFGALGGISSAATLLLARRAPRRLSADDTSLHVDGRTL